MEVSVTLTPHAPEAVLVDGSAGPYVISRIELAVQGRERYAGGMLYRFFPSARVELVDAWGRGFTSDIGDGLGCSINVWDGGRHHESGESLTARLLSGPGCTVRVEWEPLPINWAPAVAGESVRVSVAIDEGQPAPPGAIPVRSISGRRRSRVLTYKALTECGDLTDAARHTVDAFDQAETQHMIRRLGHRGELLADQINELRAALVAMGHPPRLPEKQD